ncbi:MAG: diacylglycerol kinase family protein [Nocardioides sp.]|nr:diacylglycerol kinase family protein [Nocardioides sp.]
MKPTSRPAQGGTAVRTRRAGLLPWTVLTGVTVALLTTLVALGWEPLLDRDAALAAEPYSFTAANPGLAEVLRGIDVAFGTIPMMVATILAAVLLRVRDHARAAYWTLGVMGAAAASVTVIKNLIGRDRPEWADPLRVLESYSFPSGHATSIAAAAGVATVLTLMLVRRRSLRRGLLALYAVLVLVVGLDRVFLGLHNVSDVVAGWALGAFWVLLGQVLYDPHSRSTAAGAEPFAEVFPGQRRLAVVLNPIKVEDEAGFRALVSSMAAESGWGEPEWHLTTIEDPGGSMAEAAAVGGSDLVIVCGGDGTVRTVCSELAGTGVPVGIVPAGTGNLLARNLGIPLVLRAAVDVALNGQDRAIDLVAVSGDGIEDGHFLVMAGMGFDAAIMEGVSEDIKARVGWLAYVWSGLKSLMFPAVRIEVTVDGGEPTKHRARTVLIGNVGYLQAGMPLLPDATIDDGQVDVVLLYPRRFLSWIPLAVRVLSKGRRTDELITRMTGRTVRVRASTDTPRQLDGDSIGPGRELVAECIHGKLLVRVPR